MTSEYFAITVVVRDVVCVVDRSYSSHVNRIVLQVQVWDDRPRDVDSTTVELRYGYWRCKSAVAGGSGGAYTAGRSRGVDPWNPPVIDS